MIGQVALSRVVRHPSLAGLPFILETPNELRAMPTKLT